MERLIGIAAVSIITFSLVIPASCEENAVEKSTSELRERLETERANALKLNREQEKIENSIEENRRKIKNFDQILQSYNYNIEESQKIIDAAKSEIDQILDRKKEREIMFYRCISSMESIFPFKRYQDSRDRLVLDSVSEAAIELSRDIFSDMQAEFPRLEHLQGVLKEREEYQNRILQKYMPIDYQQKEVMENLLSEKEEEVKINRTVSKEVQQRIEDLRNQLASAQKKIEEIRRKQMLEERKRREEEKNHRSAQESQSTASRSPSSINSPPGDLPDLPISEQRGKLPWPAAGDIVRPFGEFTHPQFNVTMRSTGIDVRVPKGMPIRSVGKGYILYVGDIPGFGRTVIVDHGGNYMTVYGNLTENVTKDQTIASRRILGDAAGGDGKGNTTYHFEIWDGERPLNPLHWLSR